MELPFVSDLLAWLREDLPKVRKSRRAGNRIRTVKLHELLDRLLGIAAEKAGNMDLEVTLIGPYASQGDFDEISVKVLYGDTEEKLVFETDMTTG